MKANKLISLITLGLMICSLNVGTFAANVYTQDDVNSKVAEINSEYNTEIEVNIKNSVDEAQFTQIINTVEIMAQEEASIQQELQTIQTYAINSAATIANPDLDTIFDKSQYVNIKLDSETARVKQSVKAIRDSDKKFKEVNSIKTTGGNNKTTFTTTSAGRFAQLDQGITLKTYQEGKLSYKNGNVTYTNLKKTITCYWP